MKKILSIFLFLIASILLMPLTMAQSVVGTETISRSIYYCDDDLSDYPHSTSDQNAILYYISTNFSSSAMQNYCFPTEPNRYVSIYDEIVENGSVPIEERCYTKIKRTYNIDNRCGESLVYRYVAIAYFSVYHYSVDASITGYMDSIRGIGCKTTDEPVYADIYELMADNPNVDFDAECDDKLELIHDRDVIITDDYCYLDFMRYYKVKDKCADYILTGEWSQEIYLDKKVKVKGPLAPFDYAGMEEAPSSEHDNIEHIKKYGGVVSLDCEDVNLVVSHHDYYEDILHPEKFRREFTITNFSCPQYSDTISQIYEKSILFHLSLPERYVFSCDAMDIGPVNTPGAILSYLSGTDLGGYMDILKFEYPPYNEYDGNLTIMYSDHSHDYSNSCKVTFRRTYMFIYEYYGEMYSNIVSENINALRYDNTYESFEVEIDGDTLPGFESFHLPTPMKDIWEFAEVGVEIHQLCNDSDNISITHEDEETDDDGCATYFTRTYTIKNSCTNALLGVVTQKFVLYRTINISGLLNTIYYDTEEAPEPDNSIHYLNENGVNVHYKGKNEPLKVTSVDVDVSATIPDRIKRTYYISTQSPCDTIIDSVAQYLVKIKMDVKAFDYELVDLSYEGANDGALIIRAPNKDEFCPGIDNIEDSYTFVLTNYSDDFTMKAQDDYTMVADSLPSGSYNLKVFPNCDELAQPSGEKPVYEIMFELEEQRTQLFINPWMTFSAFHFYVESFGMHYKLDEDGNLGDYFQNDDFNPWNYYFTVDGGRKISSVWDGGETFQFYPSIQTNYELNSIYYKPEQTIQLTMDAVYLNFHAENPFTNAKKSVKKIIYRSLICLSNDPNEIYGPAGYGEDKMISPSDRIDYKILFENDPELATAAAARVKITCPLHENANPTTTFLGQYGFGNYIFEVPPMSTYYNTRHDLADSLGVWVDVNAGIDVENNEMFWIFQSIDPETGVAPVDTIGFLPVNDTLTGCGEGFVTFSVMCENDMITGDTISEQANIIFDDNDNILTNTYTNMFDAVPPTSVTVCDTLTVAYDNRIILKSLAQDDNGGSGIRQIDVYVNVDNTQYVLDGSMYPDTIGSVDTLSYSYRLGEGSLYQFIMQAVDNVGNKENFSEIAHVTYSHKSAPQDIYLSNTSFQEDDEVGTLIGEFHTIDDQSTDNFVYSFVDDENYDNNLFTIEGNRLKTNHDFRCYGSYVFNVKVRSEDVNGDGFEKMFILFAEPNMIPPVTAIDHYLCYGESVEFNGMIISEDGNYYDTLSTIHGCDSVVKLMVYHRPDPVTTLFPDEYVCMYEDYNDHGMNISWDSIQTYLSGWNQLSDTTLMFKRDTTNVYGCSDTIAMYLTVHPATRTTNDILVCANEMPYLCGDSIFLAPGTKDVVFSSVLTGCDSIVTINLDIAPSYFNVPVAAAICENEFYTLFDTIITDPGTYYRMGQTIHGCDSSVVLTLEVLPVKYGFDTLSICASELPYTYEHHTFDESTISGNYDVVFPNANCCDSVVTLDLTIRHEGNLYNNFSGTWDWFSTFIDDEEVDVFAELKEGLSIYGKTIKSNLAFVNYSGGVWSGLLNKIENEQMYMVQTTMPQTTEIVGCVADPEEHPITIKKGWNHIGYISEYTADVNDALAGLNVTPQDGDIIKSYRDGFAVYFESLGKWFGDLTMLQPGQGYQYLSFNNDDITLTYPQMSQNSGERKSMLARNWTPSYKYPNNMTFIADIVVDDLVHDSDTLEVGAFCNGEQRGNARAIYIKEVGAYRLFLTTYGNDGDELYFMLYDHECGGVAAQVSNQRVTFEVNATYGSLVVPFSFEFNTKYNTLIEADICLGETYEENGFKENLAGSYFNRLKDENGNDSIVKLKLGINPVYRIAEDVIVEQFPYEYDGTWIEEAGVHTFNYTSVHGCDSIMVCSFIPIQETMNLMLTPNPADKKERVMVLYNFTEEEKAGLVVEVYNNLGVIVQSMEPTRFPIELREIYASGSYVIRVITGTGKILTAKLIIM